LINADIQAAMNIGRKELGNEWLKELLEVDGGIIMDMPVTIRKIHQKMDFRRLLELGVRSQETTHVSAW
jgi:putative transposase